MIPLNRAEVRFLLQDVTDSNFQSIRRELCQLVDCGLDGCILLLQVCLDEVLLNAGAVKNFQLKHDLLSSIFRYCLDKTYFSTCFCEALRVITATDGLLESLSNVLELSAAEKVGIGLALSDSENSGMKLKGQQFSIAQIEELCSNPIQAVPNDQVHEIVVFLQQTDGLSKYMDTFSNIISLLKVGESPFFAPIPNKKYDVQSTNHPLSPTSLVVRSPRQTLSLLRNCRPHREPPRSPSTPTSSAAGPKPSEVYGFVGSITTVIATAVYLVWAYTPEPYLHSLSITYYPSKYWALAVPSFMMVAVALSMIIYMGFNFLATPPPTYFNTIFDEHSRERTMFSPVMEAERPIEPISDISIDQINNLMFGDG